MRNASAPEYFHVLLAAYEALHNDTPRALMEALIREVRAQNPDAALGAMLEEKVRRLNAAEEAPEPALETL
jgi:hypothetical protein